MADIFSSEKRSDIMSKIHGKDTKPEILVRKYLYKNGFRYRKNVTTIIGKPDILLRKYNTIIFVHGCFWHGHEDCKIAHIPKSNSGFWSKKIERNINRDKKNSTILEEQGWKVITVWECEINTIEARASRLEKLINEILA